MEYTMEWNNRMYYPIAVKYNGMLIGTLSVRERFDKPNNVIRASMYLDYGSGKYIELEADKEEKSWGLNPKLAAKAIWKYHLKHVSLKERLYRWYQQTKTIWNVIGDIIWKASVVAAALGAASSDDIDVLQCISYITDILDLGIKLFFGMM